MADSRRGRKIAAAAALGVGVSAAVGTASAQAADLTVTTTADSGSGSLREAINSANADTASKDRILFQSGLSGTINLASDLPQIYGPLDIDGPGKNQLTVDGGDAHAIFYAHADLSVSGLTIANGKSGRLGGGIGVYSADLSVSNTKVSSSYAVTSGGGIAIADGKLTLSGSELTDNASGGGGGGLLVFIASADISGTSFTGNKVPDTPIRPAGGGALLALKTGTSSTIRDSVFSGNSAGTGGGVVASSADLSIDSTLFSGNSASIVSALKLGASSQSHPYSISNSTFTGNTALAGGAINTTPKSPALSGSARSNTTIESSTITGNITTPSTLSETYPYYAGGGIVASGTRPRLNNSIVSGNSPSDITTTPTYGTVPPGSIAGSFNLVGDVSGAIFNSTVPGSNVFSKDPQLGPLADNGGPTRTMLPAATSPVVNKGSSTLTVDARDQARPVEYSGVPDSTATGANGADIGAVELQNGPPPPPVEPPNAFSFLWVRLNEKTGVASLQVEVPGPGQVVVAGSKTVAKSSKSATKAGVLVVAIKAKGKAAKALQKNGKAKVKASVSFTPTGGKAKTQSKTVKLVKAKKKKKK